MKKKSFIVHDLIKGDEILIASIGFCYAEKDGDETLLVTDTNEFYVRESIREVQALYDETED